MDKAADVVVETKDVRFAFGHCAVRIRTKIYVSKKTTKMDLDP